MSTTARGKVRVEQGAKRVRAYLDGKVVADTTRPLLVWEVPYYPVYYIPAGDVRAELTATGDTRHSPSRGDGQVHDVRVDGSVAPAAGLVYPDPGIDELRDHVRLDWPAMSAWFEEDEQVFVHPRSPTTRIDILPSSRRIRVLRGATVLADTDRAHVLHETGLPPRWYLPQVDVRMDLLAPSDTVTHCPYKGTTTYLTAMVDGETVPDIAWIYPTPLPESIRVAGLVSFSPGQVTTLVDGEPVD